MPAQAATKPRRKRISPRKQRKLVENAIDRLVELLDEIEPDPDDEPSLGWTTAYEGFPQNPSTGYDTGDDREGYGASGVYSRLHEGDDEPDWDGEATLGWSNPALNVPGGLDQTTLHTCGWGDEVEPTFGWTEQEARYGHYRSHYDRELEEQCEDEGAQDDRELDQQGFTNRDSAQYHTPQWREHMRREFEE